MLLGTTFVELLVVFFIVIIILSQFAPFIRQQQRQLDVWGDVKQLEWHIFLIQLEKELKETEMISLNEKELLVYDSKKQANIVIQQYKHLIRKQVNGKGHQPLLSEVKNVKFIHRQQFIDLEVEMENGERYNGYLFVKSKSK